MDEPSTGGLPLRSFCYDESLGEYLAHRERYTTRVFLVPSLSQVSHPALVAAILIGARIQLQPCTRAVRYHRLWATLCSRAKRSCLEVAYTRAFAEANKETVAVLRNAALTPAWGVQWFKRRQFVEAWAAREAKKASAKEAKRWTLFCCGPSDPDVPKACARVARTAPEFASQLARAIPA